MLAKLNRSLIEDITPLLSPDIDFNEDDAILAFGRVWTNLIQRIPGDPWKSSKTVIDEIRQKIPKLLIDVVK
jgi:hypothetical protein